MDAGISAYTYLSWAKWLMGYPDQAVRQGDMALHLAKRLNHPYTIARTLSHNAMLHQLRRDTAAVQERIEAAMTAASEHGFALIQALGPMMQGWADVVEKRSLTGLENMQQGLSDYRSTGIAFQLPHLLTLLAEGFGLVGRPENGLTVLEEAQVLIEATEERYYEAELYRQRGELLFMQAESHQSKPSPWPQQEAEACFQQALGIASGQQAKSLELRAAMSLARLWRHQDKRREAHNLLAPIYHWFTEGFDTADLKEAATLLHELCES
jgi:predicted ATPase